MTTKVEPVSFWQGAAIVLLGAVPYGHCWGMIIGWTIKKIFW